ncbi:MAG: right-handed parallel beta-helix repeat-containing protein [Bacteroidia bacterium]
MQSDSKHEGNAFKLQGKRCEIAICRTGKRRRGCVKKEDLLPGNPVRISNQNNLTLDGAGSTFIMKAYAADVVFIESSSNITLKNFKATHIEPEGPIGCTGSVIQVYGNENVTIENCQLNGSGIIGVVAYDTKNLKISGNHIYNNSKYGILYQGDGTLEIVNNTFENNGERGDDHVGKALDPGLGRVEKIGMGTNEEGLKMSKNTIK